MNKYAIIQLVGKQFKIAEGEQFIVDRLNLEEGKTFAADEVLLVSDGKTVKIGTPLLSDAKVQLKVITDQQSKKIRVLKYKAKSRYRKVRGHRQQQTVVEVVSIK